MLSIKIRQREDEKVWKNSFRHHIQDPSPYECTDCPISRFASNGADGAWFLQDQRQRNIAPSSGRASGGRKSLSQYSYAPPFLHLGNVRLVIECVSRCHCSQPGAPKLNPAFFEYQAMI